MQTFDPEDERRPSFAPPATAAPISQEPDPRPFWLDLQVWARDIVISVAIAAIVIVFLYQPVKVEGTSMMPWLEDQERIFVNKFIYRLEAIQRGDVIVFRFPLDPKKSYIKRVVGLPGDRVAFVNGRLILNDEIADEPYVLPEYSDSSSYSVVEVPKTISTCWAITAIHRTTAAHGALSSGPS